ncbi:hypothetical protein TMES_09155 [Thalassospira mesophila]|uniref:Uncharacterized protein n=1 Tax=Thalassospira mesophila TaxID=1293891 RepID=A0A1Y2L0Y9_9PROT|nr:hypothetical protein TMES_09155 [Thalassospira mesophila]
MGSDKTSSSSKIIRNKAKTGQTQQFHICAMIPPIVAAIIFPLNLSGKKLFPTHHEIFTGKTRGTPPQNWQQKCPCGRLCLRFAVTSPGSEEKIGLS